MILLVNKFIGNKLSKLNRQSHNTFFEYTNEFLLDIAHPHVYSTANETDTEIPHFSN